MTTTTSDPRPEQANGRAHGSTRLDPDLLERAAETLRVLAHPIRLRMIERLLESPISVGDLAEEVGLAPAAVSQHLNMMRAQGLLSSRREGRQVFYTVCAPQPGFLLNCIRQHSDKIR